ncbi:hypothetical protein HMI56_002555 [Coelomomyces lativittatus]|nr:hypothetical protein HMI56_002555 [Coelomomyces lativittatus]
MNSTWWNGSCSGWRRRLHLLCMTVCLQVFFFSKWTEAAERVCVSKKGPCIRAFIDTKEPTLCTFNISFLTPTSAIVLPAFGFGETMANASIFMVKKNEKSWIAQSFLSTGYTMPTLTEPSLVTMVGTTTKEEWTHVVFKRPLISPIQGHFSIENKNQNMVYALFDNEYSSGHGEKKGTFLYNAFSTNTKIRFLQEDGASTLSLFKMIHAICMATAWSICSFSGAFIARYMKHILSTAWFKLHILFFTLVLLLSVGGFVTIFLEKKGKGVPHFTTPHGKFGLSILIGMVVQFILGIVIDRLFSAQRRKIPFRDKLHWFLGYIMILAGAACVIYGHIIINASTILYLAINAGVIVLGFFAFAFGEYQYGQQHDTPFPPSHSYSNKMRNASKTHSGNPYKHNSF